MPAEVVAPVPPRAIGSVPLVTSAALCLCTFAANAALALAHRYDRPVRFSTLSPVGEPSDATRSIWSVAMAVTSTCETPIISHEPPMSIHSMYLFPGPCSAGTKYVLLGSPGIVGMSVVASYSPGAQMYGATFAIAALFNAWSALFFA